ncbi:hypothetical protein ACFVSW_05685 [Neobacillus sp. NPDC058068]|uniref:hypothetical protein n=1 Tax=Neobacillus sp. NPDC058068 TaxID=3346325 RepID=UPI0036D7E9AD
MISHAWKVGNQFFSIKTDSIRKKQKVFAGISREMTFLVSRVSGTIKKTAPKRGAVATILECTSSGLVDRIFLQAESSKRPKPRDTVEFGSQ